MIAVTLRTTALALVLSFTSAAAAPATVDRSPVQVADSAAARPTNASEVADEPATCAKARKRLWIEGEGWVVRKITTCH